MNRTTLTSKTGLTAIASILAMALGMYTGTVPIGTGAQAIMTALIGLFLRDAVTNVQATADRNGDIAADAREAAHDSNAAAQDAKRTLDQLQTQVIDGKGGA